MDKLNNIKEELERILSNFNKSKNRQYTNKTLQEKEEQANTFLTEAKKYASIPADAETVIQFRKIYIQINGLVDDILKLIESQKQSNNMAFDMKTATSLVQYFNGNHDETDSFIEAIELLDKLTPADHKNIMIKFIKTRITGKAKQTVTSEVTTVAQIKIKLRQKFSAKLSSDALLAQLKACKQNNKKLTDFANQMEDLSEQLARAFIAENVATGEIAEKLAEKFAIQSFKENLANQETSIIVKASNLDTLSEITAKAISIDKPQASANPRKAE